MIQIAVDGAPWASQIASWESAEALFAAVERELISRGRSIIEVACNGVPLREEDLNELDGWIVREGDLWTFTSREQAAVVRDAISGALEFTGRLEAELRAVAERLRREEPGAVQRRWRICLDGLSVVSGLTALFQGAAGDLAEPLGGALAEIGGTLGEIETALQSEDWVYVADIIEARLAPKVSAWRGGLEGVDRGWVC